jgi:hypothetical protein
MTTLSVGHMALHILWLDFGDRPVLPVEGRLANALRQVWPVEDRAVWPPPLALDEAAMDAISNSYGGDF